MSWLGFKRTTQIVQQFPRLQLLNKSNLCESLKFLASWYPFVFSEMKIVQFNVFIVMKIWVEMRHSKFRCLVVFYLNVVHVQHHIKETLSLRSQENTFIVFKYLASTSLKIVSVKITWQNRLLVFSLLSLMSNPTRYNNDLKNVYAHVKKLGLFCWKSS